MCYQLALEVLKTAEKYSSPLVRLVGTLDLCRANHDVLTKCCAIARDPEELRRTEQKAREAAAKEAAKTSSSAVAVLAPVAAALDEHGDPTRAPTTRSVTAEKNVEVIPWTGWLGWGGGV